MPDEEGHNGASDQLGVVILRDIGRGGVAESDEEADASSSAERTRDE